MLQKIFNDTKEENFHGKQGYAYSHFKQNRTAK